MLGDHWEEQEAGTQRVKIVTLAMQILVQPGKVLQSFALRARLRKNPLSTLARAEGMGCRANCR